jgi:hypothetical protein
VHKTALVGEDGRGDGFFERRIGLANEAGILKAIGSGEDLYYGPYRTVAA